jgi:hypothetical protein
MNIPNEIPENNEPENGSFTTPIRSVRTVIDGRPTVTTFTVERRLANRFEIYLHNEDRFVRVPRAPDQNAEQALRAWLLNGGDA